MFQRSNLLQPLICHVEACLEGVLSDVQLVLFCFRGARTVVTRVFLLTCTVFQRATRRMAHCLFASSRCECFRVSTSVSSELHVGFERCFLEGTV